jgi:signal transduction histidine kinase
MPEHGERPSPGPAYCFIGVVCGLALAVLMAHLPALTAHWQRIGIWVVINLLAEFMWLPTVTGRATSSMASTINYATIFILGPAEAVWAVPLAVGLATRVIQWRSWLKSAFNLGQMVLAVGAAAWFYAQAGGEPLTIERLREPAALVPYLNAGVVYFLVNTFLVAVVVGLWEGESILRVWRQNYGYADDLLTSLTLFLLSPLTVMAYLAVGLWGVAFCFLPMLLVRNAAKRYIELRQTQAAMLWNERMAAMGEMSAEIGHELANILQVISAQAQVLLADDDAVHGERAQRAVRHIFERATDIRRLAKGLTDFSHREIIAHRQRLSELVRETVEMVEPQNHYDGIDWELELDDEDPPIAVDGGQLRQVMVNLYRNAADALREQECRRIQVRVRTIAGGVRLEVADNGPGFATEVLERAFEPWLTTKPDGHGFGLAVCYRIVRSHGGTIRASNRRGGGAQVTIELPVAAPDARELERPDGGQRPAAGGDQPADAA